MAKEIERRFLVRSLGSEMPVPERKIHIEQGYFELVDPNKSMRLRIEDDNQSRLTSKSGKGISREEIQVNISENFSTPRELYGLCDHKLEKERWIIDGWEVDILKPPLQGIILAERELSSKDEPLVLPSWLKGVIEVTDTLTNHHLARLASDLRGIDVLAMPYLSRQIFNTIPKIVLTGPPCSGKTAVIEKIKREMPEIHCVPEMASIVISQFGITPSGDSIKGRRFQRAIYRAQRIFEATSIQFAMAEDKSAVLFDRGTMDGAAYMKGGVQEFEQFLNITKDSEYKQYDLVIFMDIPSKDIYEKVKSNNPARKEDYETACDLGTKIDHSWVEHPNFHFIADKTSWELKEKAACEAIKQAIKAKTSI